jgi:hypothetical protein
MSEAMEAVEPLANCVGSASAAGMAVGPGEAAVPTPIGGPEPRPLTGRELLGKLVVREEDLARAHHRSRDALLGLCVALDADAAAREAFDTWVADNMARAGIKKPTATGLVAMILGELSSL